MPLVEWNDSYSVQNAVMDKQHQKLFDLLNNLHEAMGQGKGKEALPVVLASLVQYTKTHFADEEALLQKHNYPDLVTQKKEHAALIAQIADLQQQFQSEDFSTGMKTRDFLRRWLVDHIKGHDQKYGIFLSQKGIR